MKVAVFDYGAGNLHSLLKALAGPGVEPEVVDDPRALARAGAIVLPGVGAFAAAAARLAPGRDDLLAAIAGGTPCLGICLGLQLLFDASAEGGGRGLGAIPGRVERLAAARVPHMGWNAVQDAGDPLLAAAPLATAYFAHSFVARPADPSCAIAWTTHEADRFASVVRAGRAVGVQFHPEKSGREGVRFVRAWLEEARACV